MIGFSMDELVNMHISQLEAIEGPEQIKAHIEKVVAQGYDLFETATVIKMAISLILKYPPHS